LRQPGAGAGVAEGGLATAAPTTRAGLLALLKSVESGELGPAEAAERLEHLPFRELGFARIDTARELRQGAPEAVLAEGKAPGEIEAIVRAMLANGVSSVLVTRADDEARAAVARAAPGEAELDERARLGWVVRERPAPAGAVAIVSGGTADGPVVREAEVRASLLGAGVSVHRDAGVAGLARLEPALDDLRRADCVVVVAGLDAALASVVGGLVAAPVIGVPTSAGYGTAFGGITPLLAMLSSCAAGLAVVGIDDGFGAGTIAGRIARAAVGAP
jgi:pyridinium-3,5-biscarboxylic acid mononucleotide synthase